MTDRQTALVELIAGDADLYDVGLVEELRALHVWPQFVADHHADILTPRQINGLYNVGDVAHRAADAIASARIKGDKDREAPVERPQAEMVARKCRAVKYLEDEKAARENLTSFPERTRQRLEAWQEGQSEWFNDTLLEIVAEFITFDDAQTTSPKVKALVEAVKLAANRLDRVTVEAIVSGDERMKCELRGWADEARSALAAFEGRE